VADAPIDDGCTGFPEVWRGIDLTACCNAHDLSWQQNMDVGTWLGTNVDLAVCFGKAGAWELVIPAFIAVSTIGAVLYFVFRKKR
jgi:hypothetical protein